MAAGIRGRGNALSRAFCVALTLRTTIMLHILFKYPNKYTKLTRMWRETKRNANLSNDPFCITNE